MLCNVMLQYVCHFSSCQHQIYTPVLFAYSYILMSDMYVLVLPEKRCSCHLSPAHHPFSVLSCRVPMDQPAVSLAMLQTLVYKTGGSKKGFLSSIQNLARANTDDDARMCKLDQCPNCLPSNTEGRESGSVDAVVSSIKTITLSNIGVLLAAFATGIIVTILCQRRQRVVETKRVLASIEDDMELTENDSVYRDSVNHVEDGQYT